MEKQERQFKGIWIPAVIWLDPSLTATEKVLLADIDSFTGNNKSFYKSNETIASELFVSIKSVSRSIKKLKDLGYIVISGNKRQRLITSKGQFVFQERQKVLDLGQNVPSNESKCLTINTTTNSSTNTIQEVVLPFDDPKFLDAWNLWKRNRKKKYTPVGEQKALSRLAKMCNLDLQEALDVIDYSLAQGYTGLYKEKNGKQTTKKFDTDVYTDYLNSL